MAACRSPPAGTRMTVPDEGVDATALAMTTRGSSGSTATGVTGVGPETGVIGAGAATITVVEALLPSTVPVTVAAPAATPVTSPLPEMLATEVGAIVQVTTRPASGCPLASKAAAVACVVC